MPGWPAWKLYVYVDTDKVFHCHTSQTCTHFDSDCSLW